MDIEILVVSRLLMFNRKGKFVRIGVSLLQQSLYSFRLLHITFVLYRRIEDSVWSSAQPNALNRSGELVTRSAAFEANSTYKRGNLLNAHNV